MVNSRSCEILCQCDRCRASFEMTGRRSNGTLDLEFDQRVSMKSGHLVDSCGGGLRLFSANIHDTGVLNITYPRTRGKRGRPKIHHVFEAKI